MPSKKQPQKPSKKQPQTTSKKPQNRELTDLQKSFCICYVQLRAFGKENGTQACVNAGYTGNRVTLAKTAHQLLKDPRVKIAIRNISAEVNAAAPIGRFKRILASTEVLGLVSFLASASLDMVLDENGKFSIEKARETGGIHALKKIKIREYTKRFKGGFSETVVTHEVELRDKSGSAELLGKHHELWTGEMDDPAQFFADFLGIPKAMLPTSLEEPPTELESFFESKQSVTPSSE